MRTRRVVALFLIVIVCALLLGPYGDRSPALASVGGSSATGIRATDNQPSTDTPWYVLPGAQDVDGMGIWADHNAPFDYYITFPSSVSILGYRKDGGQVQFNPALNRFHWTGTLPAYETWYFVVTFQIPCEPTGTNLGYVTFSGHLGNNYDPKSPSGPYIVRWPNLRHSEKKGPYSATVGDEITYEINLRNTGRIGSTITITDAIPSGSSFVKGSKSASRGKVSYDGQAISWQGIMEPEDEVTIQFRVRLNRIGAITNNLLIDEGIIECRDVYTKTFTTNVKPLATATATSTYTRTPTRTRTPTYTWTPTHTWTATPTRTRTRTATPTNTPSPTRTATPTSIPCQDLILNGGFEDGLLGWQTSATGAGLGPGLTGSPVADGSRSAVLGTDAVTHQRGYSYLSQELFIPENMRDVSLHFNYMVRTDELPAIGRLFDWFQFEIVEPTTGESVLLAPAVGANTGWVHERIDLDAARGHWIRLRFTLYNDGWMPTRVYIDSVHLCDGVTAVAPIPTPGMLMKQGYDDYAPSGVPDFDQRQSTWDNPPGSGIWEYCGPVAVANSFWWFDSKFEPDPKPPSEINDNYPLLQPYGSWDDHDARNVVSFVNELAWYMDTCGIRTEEFGAWSGTYINHMRDGIVSFLRDRGLLDRYTVTLRPSPSFEWVAEEVERCEDVILLVGFYRQEAAGWQRYGGHFVTMAGVDINRRQIAFSDPGKNVAAPSGPKAHNNAANVSHDVYAAVPCQVPGTTWALQGYGLTAEPNMIFRDIPAPADVAMEQLLQEMVVAVESALAVSPVAEDADEQAPPPVVEMYWKGEAEAYADFAPAGVPDFDQRQGPLPNTGQWSYCGPVALANSLWWFDSKFEPNPLMPPEVSDGYPLLSAYDGTTDDHDARNVPPFVRDLANRLDTDGQRTGSAHQGTKIETMAEALRAYLIEKNLVQDYTITLRKSPTFDWLQSEVRRCEDVVLLLGFWELQADGWKRLGGHYVTAVGVGLEADPNRVAISDPFRDAAEQGSPGRVVPPPLHAHEGPSEVLHNAASYLSHDVYRPESVNVPDALWGLQGYAQSYEEIANFQGQNTAHDLQSYGAARYQGGAIVTAVDYALAVSPAAKTVTLRLDPDRQSISVGQIACVEILIDAGTQPLDSVEIHIEFDPAKVQIVDDAGNPVSQIAPGPDLPIVMLNSVDAGSVHYIAGIMGDEVQGRVLVGRFHIKGQALTKKRPSAMAFTWNAPQRSDVLYQGNSVLGAHQNTEISIRPAKATVQGMVQLEGRPPKGDAAWQVPLEIVLYQSSGIGLEDTPGSGQAFGVVTDEQGRFEITDVTPGVYDISAKNPHTLSNLRTNVSVQAGSPMLDMGLLLEGDYNNDNLINLTDFSGISASYGKGTGDPGWDPRADLNSDGIVDDADVGLLRANLGKQGHVLLPSVQSANSNTSGVTLASNGGVTMALHVNKTLLSLGEVVTLDVIIQAGSQRVDAAEVHLVFDPAMLAVVDGQGNQTSAIQPGTALPVVLINAASPGMISFGAGDLRGAGTSGDILLARAYLKSTGQSTALEIRYATDPDKVSDVAYDGESVLTYLTGCRISAGPTATPTTSYLSRLPLLLKP